MLRKMALAGLTAVGLCATGSTALAQPKDIYGSDTLFDLTTARISQCSLTSSYTYRGTGSTQGERAMTVGDPTANPPIPANYQEVAPMSRFLAAAGCTAGNTGKGWNIGLDAISIVADNSAPANSCNTLRFTGALAGFNFDNYRDVLRVLYTGQTSKIAGYDACSASDPTRTPDNTAVGAIVPRCGSDLRRQLIANWGNMFDGGCANGDCPSGLRHAWRRDDSSGTTDTFLTLLGLPQATVRTFCNGRETEDLDPIRVRCDANEQACSAVPFTNRGTAGEGALPTVQVSDPASGAVGDLGVVQAITMPTAASVQFGSVDCQIGRFRFAPQTGIPAAGEGQECPDGLQRVLDSCQMPQSSAGQFNCRMPSTSASLRRPALKRLNNFDPRVYNLFPRDPVSGAPLIRTASTPDPRFGLGGVYRIHQTAAMANGSGTCTQADATEQIGCLVQADPCSIGYAGRNATRVPGLTVKAITVRSPSGSATVGETDPEILRLLDTSGPGCTTFGTRYPLSRKLWLNSSKGGATGTELALQQCILTRGPSATAGNTDSAMVAQGFVPMPGAVAGGTFPTRGCPP